MMTLSTTQVYISIIMVCILSIGFIIAIIQVQKREQKQIKLYRELAQEKEKLRLLNLMHPEKRNEQGWTYVYEPGSRYVGRYHENGKGAQSICQIKRHHSDRDYYGYLIANLLNDNH